MEQRYIDKKFCYSDVYKKWQLPIRPAIGNWLNERVAHPYNGTLCSKNDEMQDSAIHLLGISSKEVKGGI